MDFAIGWIDAVVLGVSILTVIIVGFAVRATPGSIESYLLGDRSLPWWAILGSIVATETSTATVLSLPAEGYGETGLKFLQIALGLLVGRVIVVIVLLPLFFKGKLFSAYEVLERQFGSHAKRFASLLFLISRNLGDGLRLYLAALVLKELMGWSFLLSALTIGGVTILYTFFGGMRSIIWNDCIQFVIYMLGGLATLFIAIRLIPGGWEAYAEFASSEGKWTVFQFAPPSEGAAGIDGGLVQGLRWLISEPYSFWAGLLGGCFLTLGTHGTDQMMVQRYLSARSQRDAGKAVLASGVVVGIQFALFLVIGTMLACFYSSQPEPAFEATDEAYIRFILDWFPRNSGLVGLMLAAIFAAAMSTLSSSLNASASAVVNDFYLPLRRRPASAQHQFRAARWFALLFGCLQVGIGIWATTFDATVVTNALTIAGYAAGLLLGLFAIGILSPRVSQSAAIVGAAGGLAVLLGCQFALPYWTGHGSEATGLTVAWPWFAMIGSLSTFSIGWCASWLLPRPFPSPHHPSTQSDDQRTP